MGKRNNVVAAARGTRKDRRVLVIGMLVIVALVAAVVVAVTVQGNEAKRRQLEAIGVRHAAAQYPAKLDEDGSVLAGSDTAKVKLDLYEDAICPGCGQLEQAYGSQVEQAIGEGRLQVRYHVLNFQDSKSRPAGYSSDAGNAALAAAKAGKFPDYHASLFAGQPTEGTAGHTLDQLVNLGERLGITGGEFAAQVRQGSFRDKVTAQSQTAAKNAITTTPTVLQAGKPVSTRSAQWLSDLLGGSSS